MHTTSMPIANIAVKITREEYDQRKSAQDSGDEFKVLGCDSTCKQLCSNFK